MAKSKKPVSGLIAAVILIVSFLTFNLLKQNSNNPQGLAPSKPVIAKSANYNGCDIEINLDNGEKLTTKFDKGVISKDCDGLIEPKISPDGKYVLFSQKLKYLDMNKKSNQNDNSLYVYLVDRRTWVKIKAVVVSKDAQYSFRDNGDLEFVSKSINNESITSEIKVGDLLKFLQDQEAAGVEMIRKHSEIKDWLNIFAKYGGINPKTRGIAVIAIEKYDDVEILFHLYEEVREDDHRATFGRYRYNRLTQSVEKSI